MRYKDIQLSKYKNDEILDYFTNKINPYPLSDDVIWCNKERIGKCNRCEMYCHPDNNIWGINYARYYGVENNEELVF